MIKTFGNYQITDLISICHIMHTNTWAACVFLPALQIPPHPPEYHLPNMWKNFCRLSTFLLLIVQKQTKKRSAFAMLAIKWNRVITSEIRCAAQLHISFKDMLQKVCNTLNRVACRNSFHRYVITILLKYVPLKLSCNFRLKHLMVAVGIEPATSPKL